MDEFVTFYDILEIKKDASSAEIKAAYHALAKKYHPDVNVGDKLAEEKIKDVIENGNETLEKLGYTEEVKENKNQKQYKKRFFMN